jgi:hypothetical protein
VSQQQAHQFLSGISGSPDNPHFYGRIFHRKRDSKLKER